MGRGRKNAKAVAAAADPTLCDGPPTSEVEVEVTSRTTMTIEVEVEEVKETLAEKLKKARAQLRDKRNKGNNPRTISKNISVWSQEEPGTAGFNNLVKQATVDAARSLPKGVSYEVCYEPIVAVSSSSPPPAETTQTTTTQPESTTSHAAVTSSSNNPDQPSSSGHSTSNQSEPVEESVQFVSTKTNNTYFITKNSSVRSQDEPNQVTNSTVDLATYEISCEAIKVSPAPASGSASRQRSRKQSQPTPQASAKGSSSGHTQPQPKTCLEADADTVSTKQPLDSAAAAEMPQQQDRQKISERITPEILNSTLGAPGQIAHASSTRHQWQAGKHTIIQQIDVETKTEPMACSEAKGCCHEGLEGRLSSSSSKQCARDLPGTENIRTCGDGEHSECSDSHNSQSDDCKHHENSPCDCCRHGHSLTSYIRNPEDCRTCFRHMGGAFVSPKYPQIRQRMLKTLNQRRDHSEDNPEGPKAKVVPPPPVSLNSIPCGKKERLIILNPENSNEDVDDLVRMIEGTKSCNDPRKAAKKARQKERKIQNKFEEDFRREEEERKLREEEERVKREEAEREEEERRKAEELKRQARKLKKKNRKKKDGEKIVDSLHSSQGLHLKAEGGGRPDESSLLFSVAGSSSGPSETVQKVLETANPLNGDGDKTRMVTIRRHPAHDNQNVVTITLSDDKEGKSPVYMLLNGHLSSDAFSVPGQLALKSEAETVSCGSVSDKKKKKNNKKKQQPQSSQCNTAEGSCYSLPARDTPCSAVLPLHKNSSDAPMTVSHADNHVSSVDLDNLNLPPGITITKVSNTGKSEGFGENITPEKKISQYRPSEQHQLYYVNDDDDFIGKKESQEFEEVINKTRRKKMKAARTTNDRDGSEETETRESPSSVKHLTRRPFICDSKPIHERPIEIPKAVNNAKGTSKTGANFKKANGSYTSEHQNGGAKPRRDHGTFRHDGYSSSVNHAQVPVMPRLHRVHLKNREGSGPSQCHVPSTNYDGRASYSSFDTKNNPSLNGVTVSERNYTDAPLTSPQQQPFLGSRGNGATSAPPHVSWTPSQGTVGSQFSHPTSLPVQAENEQEGSWNPWKDWSEHSTPEHPSPPRFGVDPIYRDAPLPKTYAFHELNQKSKSPIQRPTHHLLEGNSAQSNGGASGHEVGSFTRDLPVATQPYTSFQAPFDDSSERENAFRYQQQQQQRQAPFLSNFASFNGQRSAVHPAQQEKLSWSASSYTGAQAPAYMHRQNSDTADFNLTQRSPIQGKSGDITWEPYSGKKSPLQETAEMLHQLALTPLTQLADLPQFLPTGVPIQRYPLGRYDEHPAELPVVGPPRSEWQIGPSTARNFPKPQFQQPQESYNWEMGRPGFHSRYTGGGAV